MAHGKTKTPKQIDFKSTPAEKAIIDKIAQRAADHDRQRAEYHDDAPGKKSSRASVYRIRSLLDWQMDVTACHLNGTKLDLEQLLAFDDFNFCHDVFGIARHLDRSTGALQNCFLPRCALPAETAAQKRRGAA
jgi:hypothetical protein